MRQLILGICLTGAIGAVAAQESATFEVATVKVNRSGERGGGIRRFPGGRVAVTNMGARQLVVFAYQLNQLQLVGGPSWLENEKFDVVAKMEGNPEWGGPGTDGPDPMRLAMQTLLRDRFKLKVHRESREMDVYALMVVKPGALGAALKPSTTDCRALLDQARRGQLPPTGPPPATGPVPCSIMGSPGMLRFDGFPMAQVATAFNGQAGRIVVDRTGLTGNWQFELTFTPEQRGPGGPPAGAEPLADPNAPSFFTALQEQLGLKLESTKAPVDVTVIDAIEHPAED